MTKILLVDDEPITTQLLELLLSKDGYQALSVNDSRKALSVASVFSPDIIILDLMMPVVNGIDICKALRADPKFAKTPILFYTALGDSNNKVAAYEAGATDFFTKPIHPAELRLKIKAAMVEG
jgi:two-component system alkaline phosphatase synthesis response regulator PhoP